MAEHRDPTYYAREPHPDNDPVERPWQCSHARAVQERVERVVARLEAQRDEALLDARLWGQSLRGREQRGRASGLTTAIEALRGGE